MLAHRTSASLAGAAAALLSGLLGELPVRGADFYVAPAGDDGTAGTAVAPFRTLAKAAEVMQPGDTAHVASGTYRELVRPLRSGADGRPIRFVAAPAGAQVVVSGARPITGWTLDSGAIWKASVDWTFDEVYVDGQRMVLARWPNLEGGDLYRPTWLRSSADGGPNSIIDTVNLTQPAGAWDGASIFLVPGLGWAADQRPVASYDPAAHRISFDEPISFSDAYGADRESLYFLYDQRRLLDAPSEWYLDRSTGAVYLWLPDGGDPAAHRVEAPAARAGFDLADRSYIEVVGITVFAGDVDLRRSTHCRLDSIRHLVARPLSLQPWSESGAVVVTGSDNEIVRSEIGHVPTTGVYLGGTRNALRACHVHHADLTGNYHAPVVLAGPQNVVSDCAVHDTGRDGVYVLSGAEIAGSLLEHTEIYDVGLIAKDCAGFYTWGTSGGGTVLRYNVVHGSRPVGSHQYGGMALGMGIYFDDNSSGFLAHHNVVYDSVHIGLFLHLPSLDIRVFNNTLVALGGGWGEPLAAHPGASGDSTGSELANNLAVVLDDRGTCIGLSGATPPPYHHNGYFRSSGSPDLNSLGLEGDAVVGNPLFARAEGGDFSLREGSPMLDRGVAIPGITDGFAGSAPDLGAYERGGAEQPGPRVTPGPPTPVCVPSCAGRECGPDPLCGLSCGTCAAGAACSDGTCQSAEVGDAGSEGADASAQSAGADAARDPDASGFDASRPSARPAISGACGCQAGGVRGVGALAAALGLISVLRRPRCRRP